MSTLLAKYETCQKELPSLKDELELLQEDLEEETGKEAEMLLKATSRLLKEAEEMEIAAEKGQVKEVNKSKFWRRLEGFGEDFKAVASKILNPSSIKNVGRVITKAC